MNRLDIKPGLVEIDSDITILPPAQTRLLQEMIDKEYGISSVFFSGDYPAVYIKEVDSFDSIQLHEVRSLHRKIWNQGKVPFLFVATPTEVRVYNCYHPPITPSSGSKEHLIPQLMSASESRPDSLEEFVRVFNRVSIETGLFWNEVKYSSQVKESTRVTQVLINNLKSTRTILHQEYGIPKPVVHDLLLRSLFLLYLEDRGATTPSFYNDFLAGAKSYFDLLRGTLKSVYDLFDKLRDSFNGNLCPVTPAERRVIRKQHLELIADCFWDQLDRSKPTLFDWRVFDFKYIPIQLISEVYEGFLADVEGEDQQEEYGAYYTRHGLVEFIINKLIPWPTRQEVNLQLKRVLDPTCGSGIFLVESFKRIIEHWRQANSTKRVTLPVLRHLVREYIFGIELNEEAIKVAAFSIYLAMLDYLEPKTLWMEKDFPYLIYDPHNEDVTTQGHNLFLMNSLENGPYCDISYDIVVGNPPFKEGNLDEVTSQYNRERGYPQEKVIAFIHRATELCTNGIICLLASSKAVLFNTGSRYQSFRQFLFNQCYVTEVFNLSIFRKRRGRTTGANLFASTTGPACVLFFTRDPPREPTNSILYCAPKTTIKGTTVDAIVIDNTDISYLPRELCADASLNIWKVAMWGTQRDYQLIKLLGRDESLKAMLERSSHTWFKGVGFQDSKPHKIDDPKVTRLPYMPATRLDRYYTDKGKLDKIDRQTRFRRVGAKRAYYAPHVLIKEGQSRKQFCASYINYDCSFKSTMYGIHHADPTILKLLTAYLNSSFAEYYMFLTSSSWGVERERVKPNELLKLPANVLQISDKKKDEVALLVDRIIALRQNPLHRSEDIVAIEKQIEPIILNALGLGGRQRKLIESLRTNSLSLFNEGPKSPALLPPTDSIMRSYSKDLASAVSEIFQPHSHPAVLTYTIPHRAGVAMVTLDLDSSASGVHASHHDYGKLVQQIDQFTYRRFSQSIYFRKVVKYFEDSSIHIVKPNQRRFWSAASAYADSDEIIAELIEEQ